MRCDGRNAYLRNNIFFKLFTATAILQLAEAGRLDLDAQARSYVPEFRSVSASGHAPTVRQLLNHSSGLPNPIPIRWIHLADEPDRPLNEVLRQRVPPDLPLEREPGESFRYSNLGYLVLGRIIERVTETSYSEYMARHVLAPLGASRTGFRWAGDAATGYQRRWSWMGMASRLMLDGRYFGATVDGFTELRPFLVDGVSYGGLVGPVCDLVRLGQAMLRDGEGSAGRVLLPESARAMLTASNDSAHRPMPIGLGWHLGRIQDEEFAYHTGGGGGFRSELRVYPRLGYAVAVIANETSYDTAQVTRLIVRGEPSSR